MTATYRPALRWRRIRRAAPFGRIVAAAALAIVVAACSSAAGGASTFTYPPAPSISTMPDMNPSPAASAPATQVAPSVSEPASAAPPPSSSVPTGATLRIAAQNIQFDTDHLEAPAGQAFVLEFDNNDPGVPHNIEIKDATGASSFKGEIIAGPATVSYHVPALAAGTYMFLCDVHPTMTGTLTVK